jgi:uncharacterized membrane protein
MWSKVKILGHPVHPMLVAYPIAFYTSTLVGFTLYAATDEPFWLKFTIAVNLAGIAMALVAALPGFVDWASGIPNGTQAKSTGLLHMSLNLAALVLFVITFVVYVDNWNRPATGATLGLVLSAIGVALTVLAGFQGWRLIQDHHVGVNLSPEQLLVEEQGNPAMRRTGRGHPLARGGERLPQLDQ